MGAPTLDAVIPQVHHILLRYSPEVTYAKLCICTHADYPMDVMKLLALMIKLLLQACGQKMPNDFSAPHLEAGSQVMSEGNDLNQNHKAVMSEGHCGCCKTPSSMMDFHH